MNSQKPTKVFLKASENKVGSTLAELANSYEKMDELVKTTSIDALRRHKPGPAQHHLNVEIHTRQAYGLILGRSRKHELETQGKPKNPIMGLFGFVKQTRVLMNASLRGDPYADLILLKIEAFLERFDEHISSAIATAEYQINNMKENSFNLQKVSSNKPAKVDILFTSPYGMKLLMLIVKYDHWTRIYLPLRTYGVFDHKTWIIPFIEARKIFRQLMSATPHYKDHNLTREELHNPLHQKHIAKMVKAYGPLSDDIVSYKTMPKLTYSHNFRHENTETSRTQSESAPVKVTTVKRKSVMPEVQEPIQEQMAEHMTESVDGVGTDV